MNIVQVSGYYPPHLGGIQFCAKNVAEQLAGNGHTVTVLTSNVGAGKARTETVGNLSVRYLRGFEFAHTPFTPGLPIALARLPRGSVLHIHLSHVYSEVMAAAIAKLRGLPYVAHFHMDVDVSGPFGFLFKLYKKALLPFIIRGAAKVITLSDEQRDLVVRTYKAKAENVVVIPNGVANEFFADAPKKKPGKIAKLLFVGRFAAQKNLPRLLRALPLMRNKVQLHLVGDGEKRTEIEDLIGELGLKNVTLHGRRDGAELINVYRTADIFVIPSNREGMPLTLLEAMAAGLPVVASNVQGLREYISGNGVLVANPSPQTFATALDALIDDPTQHRRLSAASLKWARAHAWPRLVAKMETLYKEVAHV